MTRFLGKRFTVVVTLVVMGLLAPTSALALQKCPPDHCPPETIELPSPTYAVPGEACTAALSMAVAACTGLVWIDFGISCATATGTAALVCN